MPQPEYCPSTETRRNSDGHEWGDVGLKVHPLVDFQPYVSYPGQ